MFFYDGPISRAVAFEHLLTNGERFAHRLMDAFDGSRKHDQLVHLATDGESYGHHFRYGEMALAYALHQIETNQLARLTNYGEFLESHPPTHEAQIHQPSAWSCSMASTDGSATVDVTPVDAQTGTSNGVNRFAKPWIGCATNWLPCSKSTVVSSSKTRGRLEMSTFPLF